jgi:hypothetical protein
MTTTPEQIKAVARAIKHISDIIKIAEATITQEQKEDVAHMRLMIRSAVEDAALSQPQSQETSMNSEQEGVRMSNSPEIPDSSVVKECSTPDIVERLRSANSMPPYYDPPKLQLDAADEITSLTAEVERLRAALEEAARMASGMYKIGQIGDDIADAIRSLKDKTP